MADCNNSKIKDAFKGKAWAYAVMYHGVAIGKWDSEKEALRFHDSAGFNWDYVTELRVFDNQRELRFLRDENDVLLCRDSLELEKNIDDKQDTSYLMFGTTIVSKKTDTTWTVFTEDRGGELYFPCELKFKGDIRMWLNIRNFFQVVESAVGGVWLEVCDYTFTGFSKGDEKGLVSIDGG